MGIVVSFPSSNKLLKIKEKSFEYFFFSYSACIIILSDVAHLPSERPRFLWITCFVSAVGKF